MKLITIVLTILFTTCSIFAEKKMIVCTPTGEFSFNVNDVDSIIFVGDVQDTVYTIDGTWLYLYDIDENGDTSAIDPSESFLVDFDSVDSTITVVEQYSGSPDTMVLESFYTNEDTLFFTEIEFNEQDTLQFEIVGDLLYLTNFDTTYNYVEVYQRYSGSFPPVQRTTRSAKTPSVSKPQRKTLFK